MYWYLVQFDITHICEQMLTKPRTQTDCVRAENAEVAMRQVIEDMDRVGLVINITHIFRSKAFIGVIF